MKKLLLMSHAIIIVAMCTTIYASEADGPQWVEGTCGEPVSVDVGGYRISHRETNEIDFADYMEVEEPSADGSVSPVW